MPFQLLLPDIGEGVVETVSAVHKGSPDAILARVASREHRVPEAIAAWRAVAESSASIPGLPNGALATLEDVFLHLTGRALRDEA